jgi:hypothetical protein
MKNKIILIISLLIFLLNTANVRADGTLNEASSSSSSSDGNTVNYPSSLPDSGGLETTILLILGGLILLGIGLISIKSQILNPKF